MGNLVFGEFGPFLIDVSAESLRRNARELLRLMRDPAGTGTGVSPAAYQEWHDSLPEEDRRTLEQPPSKASERFQSATFASNLEEMVRIADRAGHALRVVRTRARVVETYDLLFRVVRALRPLSLATPIEDESLDPLRNAIRSFCRGIGASCFTAYVHDRLSYRTVLLDAVGVRYPECLPGFIWLHNLPSRVLLWERDMLFPPFPTQTMLADDARAVSDEQHISTVGFSEREKLSPLAVIGLRVAWGHSRAVVFLNQPAEDLAAPDGEPSDRHILNKCFRQLRDAQSSSNFSTQDERASAMRAATAPLTLAARYFNGWLASSGIEGSRRKYSAPSEPKDELLRRVIEAAEDPTAYHIEDAVRMILRSEFGPLDDGHKVNVHFMNGARSALQFKPNKEGYVLGSNEDGTAKIENEPVFPISPHPDTKLVEKSICALAASWNISLLIKDMDAPGSPWRDIDVPRRISLPDGRGGTKHEVLSSGSQIAVPFSNGCSRRPWGVINIERQSKDLDEETLEKTEVVVNLFQALRGFVVRRDADRTKSAGQAQSNETAETNTEDNRFVQQLFDMRPRSSNELLRKFTQNLNRRFGSCLAWINIYDPRANVFRPTGIAAETSLIQRLIVDEASNFGLNSAHEAKEAVAMMMPAGNGFPTSANRQATQVVRSLAEYALANRLLPRRRRNTWQLFCGRNEHGDEARSVYFPDTAITTLADPDDPDSHNLLMRYCRSLFGIRFGVARDSYASGVLWMAWPDLNPALSQDELTAQVIPTLEVTAAVFAFYRYCDPHEASNPLPMAPELHRQTRKRSRRT
ncbi:MAG: hypothetical protein IT450_09980 [Phycisphaerales bacterium]|nr:hypothetical protein [Phycisphaerales bacterium]